MIQCRQIKNQSRNCHQPGENGTDEFVFRCGFVLCRHASVKVEPRVMGWQEVTELYDANPPRTPRAAFAETCPAAPLSPIQRHRPRTERSSPAPSLPGGRKCK